MFNLPQNYAHAYSQTPVYVYEQLLIALGFNAKLLLSLQLFSLVAVKTRTGSTWKKTMHEINDERYHCRRSNFRNWSLIIGKFDTDSWFIYDTRRVYFVTQIQYPVLAYQVTENV
jgi:hypothetical protein